MIKHIAIIAATLTTATGAPAQMAGYEGQSATIAIGDLDLGSQAGQARLDRRVRQAARRICGPTPRGLDMIVIHHRCRGEVLSDAEQKIARLMDGSERIQVARRTD